MEKTYFVKFVDHSPEFYALIKQRPTAFVLLAIIASRARKVAIDIDDGIEVGEAFIGDFEKYKATLQSYRTDKKYLEKFKLATFKITNRGTVAKIVNSSIFDISRNSPTSKLTDKKQANNMQQTTKQEVIRQKTEEGASLATEKNSFFQDVPRVDSFKGSSLPNNKEDYWDLHAPRIAENMGIEQDSWKFINGKEDWLKKAKTPTPNSIKAFLESANEWDQSERY